MTEREQALANLRNLEFYSERFLKIVTKSGELQPLKFNIFQKEAHEAILEAKKNRQPFRGIWLKCRQVGLSTFGSAYDFHQTATRYHHRGTIIAHDQGSTNNLFNMCKRFRDYMPEEIRPMQRYSNEKAIVFDNPDDNTRGVNPGLGSSINVENANNLTAGRSATTQTLHISELAFWAKASIVLTGLLQSVPYEPETAIIIESTANGISGDGQEFYQRCMAAMKGESAFKFFFCKWTKELTYEMEPYEGFQLNDYEKELLKLHPDLNLRKLAWRRYKIENEMGSTLIAPEDQFKQEYPLTPEEAFIASGRPVFNIERINADIERARSVSFKRGEIAGGRIIESPRGSFRIFREVSSQGRYAIGADVAEGLESGDFSTMTVLDKNLEQVASYHGHIHPDQFGAEMIKMGVLYNEALLAPEVNNHGLTTLTHITNKSYKFVYMRQVLDERTNDYTSKAGWQTNFKTKILMLDEFVAAYREKLIKINDIELLQEMATLTLNPDGSVDLNGKDRVVSMCIALQAVKQLPSVDLGTFESSEQKQRFKSLEEMLKYSQDSEESYFD
jgi:hypothetical protein